jgi:hypothetical protein
MLRQARGGREGEAQIKGKVVLRGGAVTFCPGVEHGENKESLKVCLDDTFSNLRTS